MGDEIVLIVRFIVDLSMFAIRTTTDSTVAEFKLLVALHFDVPVDRQRLFHDNRELRNHRTIESYGLQEGNVVYLIRRSVLATASASTSVAAAATPLAGNGTPDISSKVGSVQNQGYGCGISSSSSSGLDGSSDGTVSGVLINVQYSETRFAIRVRPGSTVGEFKDLISQLQNIPVNEQRLIYSGRVLQDEKTVGSYGVQEGHVIHLARRLVPATSCTSASVASPPPLGGNSTDAFLIGAGFDQIQGFEGEASSLFGYGLPGFEQLQQHISGNPNTISEMMNIPAQNLMDEPHIVRRNPEFVYVLSNPGALRRRMAAVRILEQIREMVQNRIGRNIESLPESSMVRQRYEIVSEMLLNAPHNPWGTNAATRGFLTNNTLRNRAAGAYVPGFSGLGIPGPSGLDTQSSSFIDPATRIQALQHPATFQIIDEVIHNDPQPSSLVDFNPQVLEALQNPEMSTSQLASSGMLQVIHNDPQSSSLVDFNPQVLEAVQNPEMSMSQLASRGRLQQLRASRAFPPVSAGMFDGQTAGRAVPLEDSRVNQQLSLLHEMGFTDNYASLRALIATSGNIGAAVALLLQNLGRM